MLEIRQHRTVIPARRESYKLYSCPRLLPGVSFQATGQGRVTQVEPGGLLEF